MTMGRGGFVAQKDISEKLLEAYDDVFADIVNVLLFDGREILKADELVDQAPRSAYKVDGKLREIERDVAKRWCRQNIRIACVGLENQTRACRRRVWQHHRPSHRCQGVFHLR